jgi:outer membrane biosynthesis protein TonB
MDASSKPLAPDLSPAESKKWMGRLLIAVVFGAAIWNFVAALTTAVVLPGLARVMESDPQSPLSLGKGDFNVPAIFAAVLELCFAVIAALLISSWAERRPRMGTARRKSPSVAPAASLSISAPGAAPVREPVLQVATPPPAQIPVPQSIPTPSQAVQVAAPVPAPPAKPAESEKPAKPKAPKNVYYNLVGEPVDPDE